MYIYIYIYKYNMPCSPEERFLTTAVRNPIRTLINVGETVVAFSMVSNDIKPRRRWSLQTGLERFAVAALQSLRVLHNCHCYPSQASTVQCMCHVFECQIHKKALVSALCHGVLRV
jgi:hypothetical protein